ncbi:fungal-specific transcription factor domain-containing protein [Aspergillus californicus]
MAETSPPPEPSGWRISKACQECRKRKIKCNGDNPCKTCQLRRTPCLYREVIRQRKKKSREPQESTNEGIGSIPASTATGTSRADPLQLQPGSQQPPLSFNNSVSATHMTSACNKVQLYYGSTSHFALMHEIYRDLTAHPTGHPAQGPQGRVEEAGAGLDLFSYRRIFFGIPSESDAARGSSMTDMQIMFLPYEMASSFLEQFLSTIYYLLPIWSAQTFHRRLEEMYGAVPAARPDNYHCILIMAMAIGCLLTEHHAWGDVLYERVKASSSSFDDTVNLQTVQLSMFMNEKGRPNSTFLHLGTASRKALSAGLHKEPPNEGRDTMESAEERRRTFWYLYVYESWICFHIGRPSSLSRRDVGISLPEDSFLISLVLLSDAACRSADELYGRHHDSLLQMWKIAKGIWDDMRPFDAKMKCALGFGLDKRPQPGGAGVQQTMCITLYYHVILLTFRPFLIFRGRWNQDTRAKSQMKREIPSWLNEACGYALSAACRTIHFLCESYTVNELVRELRYHAYFLSSSCFALIFDLIHGQDLAATHLPWVHASLQALSSMRQGDPTNTSMIAIQTVLKQIDPAYEWVDTSYMNNTTTTPPMLKPYSAEIPTAAPDMAPNLDSMTTTDFPGQPNVMLYDFQGNPLEQGMHMAATSGSVGSGEDLLDFTQSDMGWDFDFSTMDLETFFSISPAFDAPGG